MEQRASNYTRHLVGAVNFDYWPIAYWINIFESADYSEYSMVLTNHADLALVILEIPKWMGMARFDRTNKKSKSSRSQDLCKSLVLVTPG
jgi:hypothetical protein